MVPRDFLSLSPAYRRKTDPAIQARRSVIIQFADERYRMPREAADRAVKAALEAGCRKVNRTNIRGDAANYRVAYRYLVGDEKERSKISGQVKRKFVEARALALLFEDGISRWSDLEALVKESVPSVSPAATEVLSNTGAEDAVLLAKGDLERINTAAGFLQEFLAKLISENEELRRQVGTARGELEEAKRSLASVEERISRIKLARLDELAVQFPHVPALFAVVEKIRQSGAEEAKVARARAIPEGLPQTAEAKSWGGKFPFRYRESFLKTFDDLEIADQHRVRKALQTFKHQGPSYPSFDTKKLAITLPGTPEGSFASRVDRELRFTWQNVSGMIEIYTLFRRGDKGFYSSER